MAKLVVKDIKHAGDIAKERVVMSVEDAGDIGRLVFLKSKSTNESVLGGPADAFWFPDVVVSQFDNVVLYSKSGRHRSKNLDDGRKTHFFYWGLSGPVWNSSNFAALVGEYSGWEAFRIGGFSTHEDVEPDSDD